MIVDGSSEDSRSARKGTALRGAFAYELVREPYRPATNTNASPTLRNKLQGHPDRLTSDDSRSRMVLYWKVCTYTVLPESTHPNTEGHFELLAITVRSYISLVEPLEGSDHDDSSTTVKAY